MTVSAALHQPTAAEAAFVGGLPGCSVLRITDKGESRITIFFEPEQFEAVQRLADTLNDMIGAGRPERARMADRLIPRATEGVRLKPAP